MNFYKIFFILVFLVFRTLPLQSQIEGSWKTIDDNTGKPRSVVEIYKNGGKWFGKIRKVLDEINKDQICIACKGEDHNKPIEGMVILKGLERDEDEYENGTIMDPENGKTYRCKIWIDKNKPNILNVRGYIAFLYRTQQWVRI